MVMANVTDREFLELALKMAGDQDFSAYWKKLAMKKECADCPFKVARETGESYLAPGRMEGIIAGILMGQAFWCHKGVFAKPETFEPNEEGDLEPSTFESHYRICRGALEAACKAQQGLPVPGTYLDSGEHENTPERADSGPGDEI